MSYMKLDSLINASIDDAISSQSHINTVTDESKSWTTNLGRKCYHCLEPLPKFSNINTRIDGVVKPMCCHGCRVAAEWIEESGLAKFYSHRKHSGKLRWFGNAARHEQLLTDDDIENKWAFIDVEPASSHYLVRSDDNDKSSRDMTLLVKDLYCSSCSWLIEKSLHQYSKDISLRVDTDAKRLHLRLPENVQASKILVTLSRLGYHPRLLENNEPYSQLELQQQQESRNFMRRIAVAGLGMMQVMTYAVATYLGDYFNNSDGIVSAGNHHMGSQMMDGTQRDFLTLISMLIATWVVFYAGKPFFKNAWNDLKNRHLGMDVPIALAIAGAYLPSVYQTLWGNSEHVYFDSAVMFVFFLQLGRFLEMRARHRLGTTPAALRRLLPNEVVVQRGRADEVMDTQALTITPQQVKQHDQIAISIGAIVPFDAKVMSGEGDVDESLLSGEARPICKVIGDDLVAGSRLLSGNMTVRASHDWNHSSLVKIERLLQQGKHVAQNVEWWQSISRWFVFTVLILTFIVGVGWWLHSPQRTLDIVLAMLIASCPCAFSLAKPVSITAASHALRRAGVLLSNANAIDRLLNIKYWCFDKTGTLTQGKTRIAAMKVRQQHSSEECLQLIASIEQHSRHVLAQAFAHISTDLVAQQINEVTGKGLSAIINEQRYYLGKRDWINSLIEDFDCEFKLASFFNEKYSGSSEVILADDSGWLATVWVNDELREGAHDFLGFIKKQNQQILMLSGDRHSATLDLAEKLGIKAIGDLLPEQKLNYMQTLQNAGHDVAMVGDGVNDAPILQHADVSIALASGSELSQAQADIVLLSGRLDSLIKLDIIARFTRRITRQNLCWALAYNALVLPLAASGSLTPWLAALGMSLSSLFVVLNALRINRVIKT